MPAAHPNLELENLTFLEWEHEVSATVDMWLQQVQIDFFMQPFVTVHFPTNQSLLLSMPIISSIIKQYTENMCLFFINTT